MRRFLWLGLPSLLLLPVAQASSPVPTAGQYGFDWLKGEQARCVVVTPALLTKLRQCEASPGFGSGPKPVASCKASSRSEYIIYHNKAQCQQELETMKANAP
ncbi:hypothetical protein [Leeia sp.]|uniref:hypothetical protein n=1 Tax=Leeia sp. TaxID=2884678 RepID=UPI0035B441F9